MPTPMLKTRSISCRGHRAMPGEQPEHRRRASSCHDRSTRVGVLRQHPGQVRRQTAPGDMGERVHLARPRPASGSPGRRSWWASRVRRRASRRARQARPVKVEACRVDDLPDQREPVGVQSGGGQPEHGVPGPRPARGRAAAPRPPRRWPHPPGQTPRARNARGARPSRRRGGRSPPARSRRRCPRRSARPARATTCPQTM